MSVKSNIWKGLKAKLLELKNEGVLKHYAIYNTQIESESTEIPFDFPALFVEFSSIIWERTGLRAVNSAQKNKQIGNVTITFHIAFEKYSSETDAFEEIDAEIDKIIEKFHVVVIDEFETALLRSAERQDSNHNNVIVWQVDFTCMVQETFEDKTVIDATGGDENKLGLTINTTI